MVSMFNPKPQLLRAVDKPDNVSSQEIAKARPVYIDGLPEGGGGGGGGPITTDVITIEGNAHDEMNGMLLNDILREVGYIIQEIPTLVEDYGTRIEAIEAALDLDNG